MKRLKHNSQAKKKLSIVKGSLIGKINKKISIILLIILSSLLLSSCSNTTETKVTKYYSTGIVFSGSINTTNNYIGYIQGDKTIKLSSKLGGKIKDIYVKEGDYVEKGALLAVFDSKKLQSGYITSNKILNTLYDTKKRTSTLFDKQILQMEAKIKGVDNSKIGSENTIIDTKNITNAQLKTLSNSIDIAKATLEHSKNILKTKKGNIYKNSKNAIVGAVILDTNIIDFADSLLGVTNKNRNKNINFRTYLSAKNTNYLTQAKSIFLETNKLYLEYKKFYDNEIDGKDPDEKTILKGLKDGEILAEKIKTLLSVIYNVLDNSIENVYFTANTINNYKNKVSSFGNNIEKSLLTVSLNYIGGLKGSQQSLKDFEEESNMKKDLLEKQLLLSQDNYKQYIAINKGKIREVEIKGKIAKNNLNEIKLGLTTLKKQKQVSLNEIQGKIDEIKGKKDIEGIAINNLKIFSPINGIVTKKIAEIGELVGIGTPILEVSDNQKLKIYTYLLEKSIKNIALFDEVSLEIKGVNKQLKGRIINIGKSKDTITKKFKIEISLNNDGNNIKIGSYTKVIFNKKTENNEVIISNQAIVSKFMIPGVYILKDKKVEFKNIKIIKQNDDFSEIKGLNIGDIIIIKGKENISDGEVLN